jgi:hypothetical protein
MIGNLDFKAISLLLMGSSLTFLSAWFWRYRTHFNFPRG